MNPSSSILDFFRSERDFFSIHLASCELEKFGRLMPEAWPRLTAEQWREGIEGAIAAGKLESDQRGNARLPREKKKVQQEGWLF